MQGQLFAFDEHSVHFNSFYGPSGAISFSGRWQADGHNYSLTMVPQGNTAQVTALTEQVSEALSKQDLEMTAISAGELCCSLAAHSVTCVQHIFASMKCIT